MKLTTEPEHNWTYASVSRAWQVISNTDLTEGKGFPVILYTTKLKETAERLAKGKGVMGSPALVQETKVYRFRGQPDTYVLGRVEPATSEDLQAARDRISSQEKAAKRKEALAAAAALGLSRAHLDALK